MVNPGAPTSTLSLTCRRWGSDAELTGAGPLTLEDGRLALPVELVDGPEDLPVMTIETDLLLEEINGTTDVLRISGIQHGDVIVLTDSATGASEQIAVVKNFSLNDLNRLRAHGHDLAMAPPLGDLGGLATTIVDAVEFLLSDGPDTEQDRQRISLIGTTTQPIPASSEPKAEPATLDVPSARGIGTFPDDSSHLHVCLPRPTRTILLCRPALKRCGRAPQPPSTRSRCPTSFRSMRIQDSATRSSRTCRVSTPTSPRSWPRSVGHGLGDRVAHLRGGTCVTTPVPAGR